jgi:hypothetical protein
MEGGSAAAGLACDVTIVSGNGNFITCRGFCGGLFWVGNFAIQVDNGAVRCVGMNASLGGCGTSLKLPVCVTEDATFQGNHSGLNRKLLFKARRCLFID